MSNECDCEHKVAGKGAQRQKSVLDHDSQRECGGGGFRARRWRRREMQMSDSVSSYFCTCPLIDQSVYQPFGFAYQSALCLCFSRN